MALDAAWQRTRARAEALLSREQRARIARARAKRVLKISDEELYERFRTAGKDATEWPGLKSEYDKQSGRVEFLAAPVKLQVQEGSSPAARGEKTTVANPVRVLATQYWLNRHGVGHGAMLPEHEAKFGKGRVLAETLDGRLHLLDGHHTIFHHLRRGGGALRAYVFKISTVAIFQDSA